MRLDIGFSPKAVAGQETALFLTEWHGGHGGQAHVEIRFVEGVVLDVVLVQLLDHTEKCDLIGDTDDNAGWDFVKI